MYNKRSRGIVPLIIVAIVIAIAVAAIISIGRAIFGGGDITELPQHQLTTVAADRSVKMTIRGPLVADENFRSYNIEISPNSRTLTTYSGYLEAVIDQERLGNNTRAYEEFVYALDRVNMTAGTPLTDDANDIRGICAAGRVYEFEVLRGGESVERFWTSTCRGSVGSLEADRGQLSGLFRQQIPDSRDYLREINMPTR